MVSISPLINPSTISRPSCACHLLQTSIWFPGVSSFASTTPPIPPHLLVSSIFSLINLSIKSIHIPFLHPPSFLSIGHKRAVCHSSVPFLLSVSHSSRLIHPFPPLHLHISPQISWFLHSIPLSFHQLWALSPLTSSLPSVLAVASFTPGLYSQWLHAWLTHSWTPLCWWRALDACLLASNATSSHAHTSPAYINNRRRKSFNRQLHDVFQVWQQTQHKDLTTFLRGRWINTNYI